MLLTHSHDLALLGCFEDSSNRLVEACIPFFVCHLVVETLSQSSGETCNHTVLLHQKFVGFDLGVSSRKSDDADAVGVVDEILVEVDFRRDGKLRHDGLALCNLGVKSFQQFFLEDSFDLRLVGTGNVHFRFQDRNEPMGKDLVTNFKLLVDNSLDALLVQFLNDRSHLGSKDSLFLGALEQSVELWHWFHQLDTILERCQSLVAFQEGDDLLLLPQVGRGGDSLDFAVHSVLEENGTECAISLETWGSNNTGSNLVDDIVHRLFSQDVLVLGDSEGSEGLGSGSTRLIEGSEVCFGLSTTQNFGVAATRDVFQ